MCLFLLFLHSKGFKEKPPPTPEGFIFAHSAGCCWRHARRGSCSAALRRRRLQTPNRKAALKRSLRRSMKNRVLSLAARSLKKTQITDLLKIDDIFIVFYLCQTRNKTKHGMLISDLFTRSSVSHVNCR